MLGIAGSGNSVFSEEEEDTELRESVEWCDGREPLKWTQTYCAVHFLRTGFCSFHSLMNMQLFQHKQIQCAAKGTCSHTFLYFLPGAVFMVWAPWSQWK